MNRKLMMFGVIGLIVSACAQSPAPRVTVSTVRLCLTGDQFRLHRGHSRLQIHGCPRQLRQSRSRRRHQPRRPLPRRRPFPRQAQLLWNRSPRA